MPDAAVRPYPTAAAFAAEDPRDMLGLVRDFPAQIPAGIALAQAAPAPNTRPIEWTGLCVAGLGGSAIGGDFVRTLVARELKIPMAVVRTYELPAWVNRDVAVICSSYSGNTEETLAAYDAAHSRDCVIYAITTGGELAARCHRDGYPVLTIPGGISPRAALGYSFAPLLTLLGQWGLIADPVADMQAAATFLAKNAGDFTLDVPEASNRAWALATALYGRLPIVHTDTVGTDTVGTRWKGQLCENAKSLAFHNVLPELNHNELVGWKVLYDLAPRMALVQLRDADDHPRVALRMGFVREVAESLGVPVHQLHSRGPNRIARLLSLIQFGDFVSVYLAYLNRVDPTPVAVIDKLKAFLAGQK